MKLDTKILYELIEIPPVHTAKETADVLGCKLEMILKSMMVFDSSNSNNIALIVIPGHKNINFDRVNQVCNFEKSRFYPKDKILQTTGFKIGTLPPFGYSSEIQVCYDRDILLNDVVYAGSGDAGYLIKFNPRDLEQSAFREL